MNTFKRIAVTLAASGAMAFALILPASASTAVTHVTWGSQAKSAGPMVQDKIVRTRVGVNSYFDRLSVDLNGRPVPGYYARYVSHCIQDASGRSLPVRGGAVLQISIKAPAASAFPANKTDLNNVNGFPAFRQIRGAGSFEGITQVCIGTRGRLPFRVVKTSSTAPDHHGILAIDVARNW